MTPGRTGPGRRVVGNAAVAPPATSFAIRRFADLSPAADPVKFLFLADIPDPDADEPVATVAGAVQPAVRLKGTMTFEFLDADGNLIDPEVETPAAVRFNLLGRGRLSYLNGLAAVVIGGDDEANGGNAQLLITYRPGWSGRSPCPPG